MPALVSSIVPVDDFIICFLKNIPSFKRLNFYSNLKIYYLLIEKNRVNLIILFIEYLKNIYLLKIYGFE